MGINERSLGYRHLGPAGHFEHIFPKGRPQGEKSLSLRQGHDGTIRHSDEFIVRNSLAAKVIDVPGFQGQGIVPAFLVYQMNAFAIFQL